jgi:multiple antibiotic resistance protein
LTTNQTKEERELTANATATTVTTVLVVSIFAGQPLLHFFGVSLPSFRVGGGILILLMAIAMMQARPSRTQPTPEEAAEAATKDEIAVVPLGIPLVAGPGAISTVIIYAHQATGWLDTGFLILSSILVEPRRSGSRCALPTRLVGCWVRRELILSRDCSV